MALEAVVFPQDLLGYTCKELYAMVGGGGGAFGYDTTGLDEEEMKSLGLDCEMASALEISQEQGTWDSSCTSMLQNLEEWNVNSSSPEEAGDFAGELAALAVAKGRRKRRRAKSCKNKEEVENQRMTHIAVERNRRKQMNEYLAAIRSLMPPSYVQRVDQASIIGGAINYVKELEQLLQSLEAQKRNKQQQQQQSAATTASLFSDFFAFPQYSSSSSCTNSRIPTAGAANMATENRPAAVADVEVTMIENHANLKVLARRRPKQLLRMVVGLQSLWLTPLHLNVTTTMDQMVLYSFSLKMEEDCQFMSVDEIATAVHQMIERFQQDSGFP